MCNNLKPLIAVGPDLSTSKIVSPLCLHCFVVKMFDLERKLSLNSRYGSCLKDFLTFEIWVFPFGVLSFLLQSCDTVHIIYVIDVSLSSDIFSAIYYHLM